MHRMVWLVTLIALVLSCAPAALADIGLFEWGFNVNGVIYAGAAPGVNSAGFDTTTGLGVLWLTFAPGAPGSYFVIAFFDHEIDESDNTFFNELGSTGGSPAAGQSWEIDEPGYTFGDIYGNYLAGSLDNSIGTILPEDVSMAMGWDFILGSGEQAVINYAITTMMPVSGFYLRQNDPDSGKDIFLTSNVHISGTQVPEPSTVALVAFCLAAAAIPRWRRARRRD